MIKKVTLVLMMFLTLFFTGCNNSSSSEKMDYWEVQRKGANGNGGEERLENYSNPEEWFKAASECDFDYIRLNIVSWQGEGRDFLLGDADNYKGIVEKDAEKLIERLDIAYKYDQKIVLMVMSLPGLRYIQDNDYEFDYKLWEERKYQKQAFDYWKSIAEIVKDHPAIVGYNIVNEPCPERKDQFYSDNVAEREEDYLKWTEKNKLSDINHFYSKMVKTIRKVDKETPIILDCSFDASPVGFKYLEPVDDENVIYSFHFYDPWQYTSLDIEDTYVYPDQMPDSILEDCGTEAWSIDDLREYIKPVKDWAEKNNIPASRIMAEEFGIYRVKEGAQMYFKDLITIFNQEGWHWSFWEFRSCGWGGYDYELGTKPQSEEFWLKRDEGIAHEDLVERSNNDLWNVFLSEFQSNAE